MERGKVGQRVNKNMKHIRLALHNKIINNMPLPPVCLAVYYLRIIFLAEPTANHNAGYQLHKWYGNLPPVGDFPVLVQNELLLTSFLTDCLFTTRFVAIPFKPDIKNIYLDNFIFVGNIDPRLEKKTKVWMRIEPVYQPLHHGMV